MGASGGSDEYTPPRLSRLLHAVPHINVTLHRVNDTFAPDSPVYLESLGIIGSIPGAWLILTLLVLLIYLLTRCCDRKQRPPKSITALKITLMFLSVLCCGAIGVGLFGNDDLHNAMLQSIQAGNQLAALVNTVKNQRLWVWEAARWGGGMAGWCCGGAVCVALLAAAARRSRRALLLLCVCALGGLVSCWAGAALLAAGAVSAADACLDPAAALAHHAPHRLSPDMVHYYLSCKVSRENVLTAELRNAQRAVVAVRQALAVLTRGAPQLFNDPGLQPALGALGAGTGEAERALVSLSGALECRMARAYFVAGARAACDAGLQALTLQLLAAVAAGFLFTAIVLVDSHAWIYINTKRSGTGEEQAPFLSSGSSAATRSLPRPAPFPNGKPPSYSAAVQLMDLTLADSHRPSSPCGGRSRMSGSATLGRGATGGGAGAAALGGAATLGRAHNGKYATLSKQCKTLESNDFY
ncbi:protein tweety-like [Bombyx mandarina]|uniref:Protein tweety homolog n=1 Tax=Bombyx mandarina TaxID=7092 RepID=A0A6J2JU09_BOMMA|nr:protein tweety-like [Bombyx mandarina]